MNKAPDAFRTISEVADELDLPQHVLRFWETRFPQVRPMKRGGGRRYYRPDDVDLLRGIRHLLYGEGYTIRGVQRILREQGGRFVQSVWQDGAPQPERSPETDAPEADVEAEAADAAPVDDAAVVTPEPLPAWHDDEDGPAPARREPSFANPPPVSARVQLRDPIRLDQPPPLRPAMEGVERAPDPPPKPAGLSADQRVRLHAVLDELESCKRLLAAATESVQQAGREAGGPSAA